jgi:hypothetical protein
MNVEIGAEAAQFPEKKYINGIAVAVHLQIRFHLENGHENIRRSIKGKGT